MGTPVALRTGWRLLGMPPKELRLEHTLPTGQSFRWRKTADDPLEFTGVVGRRLVVLQQGTGDVAYRVVARGPGEVAAGDAPALEEYFQKPVSLAKLSDHWASRDQRFRQLQPYLEGARMLRQDPLECLFSFICSSNNHISRIHGMVERLASNYGDVIEVPDGDAGAPFLADAAAFHAFPTLEQLARASEEALRADGYGYRAKFIVGAVKELQSHPEGGHAWLMGLRDAPLEEATAALQTLPGIGPKVAACVALFSLDKTDAIPVDTHVWQLALRYYCPHLKDRSLTPKVHGEVQGAFKDVFGPHCGWAHNTLFVGELASVRDKLPEHLRPAPVEKKPPKKKRALKQEEEGDAAGDSGDDGASGGGKKVGGKAARASGKKAGVADRPRTVSKAEKSAGEGPGDQKQARASARRPAKEKPESAEAPPSRRRHGGDPEKGQSSTGGVDENGIGSAHRRRLPRQNTKLPDGKGCESASTMTYQQRIASWRRLKRAKPSATPDVPPQL